MTPADAARLDLPAAGVHAAHLSTDDLRGEIKTRTISGGVVNAFSQGSQLLLTLGYNAALARLLTPSDFGLVAMVMTVTGFLQIFKDAGLSTATIQRETITQAQVSNLFWINIAVSAFAMMAMVGASPVIAWFFRRPQLVSISIALATGFLFEGLAVQHLALLNRRMRFTVVSMMEVGALAGGFAVGIAMALMNFGYWSLVGATLANGLIRVVVIWMLSGWRPSRPTRNSGTRPLVRFGADLTLVGVVYALTRGSDTLIIGRFLGTEAVGLYSRATALLSRPMERLIAPIYAVIVPALSRLQSEPARYRTAFLRVFEALAIGGFLFAGVFFPLAHSVVLVILGPKWEAAAPIFGALTAAALYLPLSTASSWLYTSQGRGRDLLVTAVVTGAALVAAFSSGILYGPTGVATGYAVCGVAIVLPFTFFMAGRTGPVTTTDMWRACARHSPLLVIVFAATEFATRSLHTSSALAQLLICIPIGSAAGLASIVALPATRSTVHEIVERLLRRAS